MATLTTLPSHIPNRTDVKALWARRLVRHKLAAELNVLQRKVGQLETARSLFSTSGIPLDTPWTPDNLPPDTSSPDGGFRDGPSAPGDQANPPRKVCIVGAGISGLYIAMILDSLPTANVTYDILEANSRIGGRVYTHHFSQELHDYYDIGAMRYPDIPTMKRTFDLFKRTNMPLREYILKCDTTPDLFNDRIFEPGPDPYHVSTQNGGCVPEHVVDKVSTLIDDAFRPYKEKLAEDFNRGFEELMKVDDFSTREFLKRGGPDGTLPKYDFFSVQWMETQNTSTNLFDQAFSESVMDSFDFDNPQEGGVKWSCIEGGTGLLTDAMHGRLSTKVTTGKRVEAISIARNTIDEKDGKLVENDGNMSVKCAGEDQPRTGYSTVFSTTSLGCLGRMDLRSLELHPSQKDAIRSLHYDHSVKVALKFSYPWWIVDCKIKGGVASTDLPLRTCVYPSYNIDDDPTKPAVLLASYTWAQDATRVASLVNRASPADEEELVELILQDLARLHAGTPEKPTGITYEKLRKAYTGEHHAYSWSHDPNTAGAFALFAPGQYSNFYPYLSRPAADSKFHIVGEAASTHHAWIVGALDSAHAAVYRFLHRFGMKYEIQMLEEKWGKVDELESGREGTVHLQVMLGMLREGEQFKV
jgi:monoamine oxidase